MKKMLVLLVLLICINIVTADDCANKQDVFESGLATRQHIEQLENKFHDRTLESVKKEATSLLNLVKDEFHSNLKIAVIYLVLSLFGVLLTINGIIGWIRLKKESTLLLLIEDHLRTIHAGLKVINNNVQRKKK